MGDANESLDFLALLDEVEEDTVSRLVSEMGPTTNPSCGFGDKDALDMLSICDSMSTNNSTTSFANGYLTETDDFTTADDNKMHVRRSSVDQAEQDNRKRTVFQAVDNEPSRQNLATKSVNHFVATVNQTGQRKYLRRQSRRQFTKWQQEQLDGVFERNMYPSKWKLTELSTALQIPMHNLRNRRWRLRKRLGLCGDLRNRGSRTMLPDNAEAATDGRDRLTAPSVRLNSPPSTSSTGNQHQIPEMAIASPTPVNPSLFPLTMNSLESSISQAPSTGSFPLFVKSAALPLDGDSDQHPSMSTLTAGWNLPSSFHWLTESPQSSALLFPWPHVQWQNYACGLPTLPQLYHSELHPRPRQICQGTTQEEKNLNLAMSSLSDFKLVVRKPSLAQSVTPTYLFHMTSGHLLPSYGSPVILSQTETPTSDCTVSNANLNAVLRYTAVSPTTSGPATSHHTNANRENTETRDSNNLNVSSTSCSPKNEQCLGKADYSSSVCNNIASSRRCDSNMTAPYTVQPLCSGGTYFNSFSTPVWPPSLPHTTVSVDPVYPQPVHSTFPGWFTPSAECQVSSRHTSTISLPQTGRKLFSNE